MTAQLDTPVALIRFRRPAALAHVLRAVEQARPRQRSLIADTLPGQP